MNKQEWEKESQHPIKELFAYIVREDGKESESIMTLFGKNGAYPLIGSDMARMLSLRGIAETVADRYGKKIVLAKFTSRKDITLGHMKSLPKERGAWDNK